MPKYFDLRILIESENGSQFSYISNSIANSSEDQISSSVFWERITSSVSCSYSNEFIDNGTTGSLTLTTGTNFESDLFLSSSISGSNEDSGSILFNDREPSDDKLKRYKFFGTHVCNVLGVPENHWILPVNFHFSNIDGEPSYLSGDLSVDSLTAESGLTLLQTAYVRSNIPFFIDKSTDRYIQWVSESKNTLLMGYDNVDDVYEITASGDVTFNIGGINDLTIDGTLTANEYHVQVNTSSVLYSDGSTIFGNTPDDTHQFTGSIYITGSTYATGSISSTGPITSSDGFHSDEFTAPGTSLDFKLSTADTSNININRHGDIIASSIKLYGGINSGNASDPYNYLELSVSGSSDGGNYYIRGHDTATGTAGSMSFFSPSGKYYATVDTTGVQGLGLSSFHVDGEITSSTTLGDTILSHGVISASADRTSSLFHLDTTNITASGNISTSLDQTSSLFHLDTTNITASGNISASGNLYGSNLYVNASGENVIQVGNTGPYMTKWEWYRDGARKWVIYNDGRDGTDGSPVEVQDALIFKSDNWGGDNTMALLADASVKFYGHVTASGTISSSADQTSSLFHLDTTNITASGNISGSSTSTASFGDLIIDGTGDAYLEVAGNISASGHLYSEGTVSASADQTSSLFHLDTTNITASGNIIMEGTVSASADQTSSLFHIDATNITASGGILTTGHILPITDNTADLGGKFFRFANLWTADIQLSNRGSKGNEIDGTTGNWTIQEGENDIFIINRKFGKRYRIKLEEID